MTTDVELAARLEEANSRIAELETARLRAETLFAVTQVLGKTLSLRETIDAIITELQRVVPYDSCSVQVIQGDRLVIVGARGLEDLGGLIGVGFDLEDETNPGIQVVRSKRPLVYADVSHQPRSFRAGAPPCSSSTATSWWSSAASASRTSTSCSDTASAGSALPIPPGS